jgi:hypothetical protein
MKFRRLKIGLWWVGVKKNPRFTRYMISTYTVVVVLMTQVGWSPAGNQVFIVIVQFVHARRVNITDTPDADDWIVDGGHGRGRRSDRPVVRVGGLVGHRRNRHVTIAAVEHGVLKHRRVNGHVAVLTIRVVRIRFHRVLLLELLLVLVLWLMLVVRLVLVLVGVPFRARVRRQHLHQFVSLRFQLLDL